MAGYAVSFVILGMVWIGHHTQFHFIRRVNRPLLYINIFYLLCVAFVPFATALLARYPLQPVAVVIYGVTLLLGGVLHFVHWNYAVDHGLVTDEVTPEVAESDARADLDGHRGVPAGHARRRLPPKGRPRPLRRSCPCSTCSPAASIPASPRRPAAGLTRGRPRRLTPA